MTRVAVVGATGAVGRTMLELLRERSFPADEIVLFASARSAGTEIDGRTVRLLDEKADLDGFDIALFSAGAGTSREWAPRFVDHGAVVIDNSSAFRRDPSVPLVVSEVNPRCAQAPPRADRQPQLLDDAADGGAGPDPARGRDRAADRRPPINRSRAPARRRSTSSTPRPARRCTGSTMPDPELYPDHIAFNVIGAAGNFAEGDDHTDEERKMMFETRKILERRVDRDRGDMRARAGPDLPFGGGQRPDA